MTYERNTKAPEEVIKSRLVDGSCCSILRQFLKGTSVKAEPPHWEGGKVSYPAHVPTVGPGKDFQKKMDFRAKMDIIRTRKETL